MERVAYRESRFGLVLALVVSLVLHLLLLLISIWIPVSAKVEPVELEESVLRFTFAPETEEDREGRIRGEVPFPTPQQPSTIVPDRVPSGPASLQPPSSPTPPMATVEPGESSPPVEGAELAEVEESLAGEPSEAGGESGTGLPLDPAAALPRGTTGEGSPESPGSTSALDLDRAIEEFGQAVKRYRASQPRSTSGGGGGRNVFVPDPADLPTTGFGVGNLTFESRDYDWTEYARSIYWEIWRAWHRRLYYTTNEFEKWMHRTGIVLLDHQVQVRFVIEHGGEVTGIVVESSSACLPLDASAVDALAEVVLQPLPPDFPRDREVVHARFIAIGPIPAMRARLEQIKRAFLPDGAPAQ